MARDLHRRAPSYRTSGANALDERQTEDIVRTAHERRKQRMLERGQYEGLSLRASEHTGQRTLAMQKRRQWSLAVCAVVIASALAVMMMLRHVEVAKGSIENGRAKDHLAELNTQIDQLAMKVAMAEDVNTVESRASSRGMGYPGEDQVFAITLPDLPTEENDVSDKVSDDNFFTAVLRALGRVSD